MSDLQKRVEALEPCPFCGGGAVRSTGEKGDGSPWEYIECIECAAMAEVEMWNRRALLAEGPGLLSRLRAFLAKDYEPDGLGTEGQRLLVDVDYALAARPVEGEKK